MNDPSASAPGTSGSSRFDLLDRLAEEFIDRYRRGERPPLCEYTERHPELAQDIRDLFPALVHIEQVEDDLRGSAAGKGGPESIAEPEPPPRRVGDFEIIREIGRGGMGVVYEAEQVSLGRRVALKILARHPSGDSSALGRFRREARSAARLHHTNIVPVFEVGQDGEIFYYAMQFIEGQGLDLVIGELRRIRDSLRQAEGHAHRADTVASALPGPIPKRPQAAVAMQVSQVARSLMTGQFGPEGLSIFADGGAEAPGDPGPSPSATPAPTIDMAFLATEVIEGGIPGEAEPASGLRGRSSSDEPVSSGPASAAGLGSTGESSRRPYYLGVARTGRQAAEALAYAHERGIIHRDIKPSNLLLDNSGVIWITDFGLAKADDDGLTHTGDVIGTFRYMAPERFRGEGDERADVYALGLTLYELLTLRPAFVSADRLRLMEKIKEEDPARPRDLDPRVPRDLETIVLKAIEKEPRRRYQTAAAMAEDLRRFGDDEPIEARPAGRFERLRLWCRRNRAQASLVAAVAAAVAIAFVAVTWGWLITESARRQAAVRAMMEAVARHQAESALRQVEAQQRRADDDLARALAVADACLAQLGERRVLRGPGLDPLRRELLRSALSSYEAFIRERGTDRAARAGLAAAYLRASRIRAWLGEEVEARRAAAQAIDLYRALAAEYPEDRGIAAGLVEGYALDGRIRDALRQEPRSPTDASSSRSPINDGIRPGTAPE